MQNHFYEHFLGELKALDDFLLRRSGADQAQGGIGSRRVTLVDNQDPDVRRLMEAVAFFENTNSPPCTTPFGSYSSATTSASTSWCTRCWRSNAIIECCALAGYRPSLSAHENARQCRAFSVPHVADLT